MSRRALVVMALAVGMVGWGAGRAAARGTLMSDQSAGSGAPAVCSAGTPNNVMVVGNGPTCSETNRLTVDSTRTQFTGVMNPDGNNSYFAAYGLSLYSWFWDTSSAAGWYANMDASQNLRLIRRNSGDRVALTVDTSNGNLAVGNVGGQYSVPELLSVGNTSQFRVDSNGAIVRERDAAPTGSCVLNGGSPSTCTATVADNSVCVCSIVGTTATAAGHGCAVSRSGTTLTITSDNSQTHTVNWLCL